jgi:hypothetical protein
VKEQQKTGKNPRQAKVCALCIERKNRVSKYDEEIPENLILSPHGFPFSTEFSFLLNFFLTKFC